MIVIVSGFPGVGKSHSVANMKGNNVMINTERPLRIARVSPRTKVEDMYSKFASPALKAEAVANRAREAMNCDEVDRVIIDSADAIKDCLQRIITGNESRDFSTQLGTMVRAVQPQMWQIRNLYWLDLFDENRNHDKPLIVTAHLGEEWGSKGPTGNFATNISPDFEYMADAVVQVKFNFDEDGKRFRIFQFTKLGWYTDDEIEHINAKLSKKSVSLDTIIKICTDEETRAKIQSEVANA